MKTRTLKIIEFGTYVCVNACILCGVLYCCTDKIKAVTVGDLTKSGFSMRCTDKTQAMSIAEDPPFSGVYYVVCSTPPVVENEELDGGTK